MQPKSGTAVGRHWAQGDSQSGLIRQILCCPSFPVPLSLLQGMSWLPGRKASTAAAHALMFVRTKGERPWFTPCLLALKHVFK